MKDEVGHRYGRLSVIAYAGSRVVGSNSKRRRVGTWKCQCDCGKTTVVKTQHLRDGRTRSCGCLRGRNSFKDRIGHRYGRLTVVARAGTNRHQHATWHAKCDCGGSIIADGQMMQNGHRRSCGCVHTRHGMSKSLIYQIWAGMRARCNNNNMRNRYHAGRGIKVCERWQKLENFLADMGERPPGKSLDRIDNNGDYSKENCQWRTPKEQMNNRSVKRISDFATAELAAELSKRQLKRERV